MMSKSVNKVALIAIIAVCSLAIGYVYQKYRVAPAIAFPNLEALDAQGSRVKIQPKPGQSLIVVFYASWCNDCAREMPKLRHALLKSLKETDVIALTDEDIPTMVKYRDLTKYPFTFYSLPHNFDHYGIHAIPTVYILNSKGEIIFQKVGDVDWQSTSLLRKINSPNGAEAR